MLNVVQLNNKNVRDYFAGIALAAITERYLSTNINNYDMLSDEAYAMADAMMRARVVKQEVQKSRVEYLEAKIVELRGIIKEQRDILPRQGRGYDA